MLTITAESKFVWGLFLLLVGLARSAKDAHYFTPGTRNPNVDEPMYWRDAVNVLQDIEQFQYLYVSFHSCAWSLFGNGQQIMNCGGNGDELSNWYMGHTACYRANAAFELYGVLKEEYGGSGSDDGCGRSTYINSFFTFMGVESFQEAIRLAGVDFQVDDYAGDDWMVDDRAFKRNMEEAEEEQGDDRYQTPDDLSAVSSYCYQRTPDDDAYVNVEYNDDGSQDHATKHFTYSQFSSYGLGCYDRSFVRKTYTGPFCDGNSVVKITDKLSGFNSQIRGMQCVKIYDADSYQEPQYDDEYLYKFRQNGNAEESHSGDAQDNSYGIDLYDSLDLLRFSRACNVLEYPKMCSDPYGLSAQYRNALYSGTSLKWHKLGKRPFTALTFFSRLFFFVGLMMMLFSYLVKKRIIRTMRARSKLGGDDTIVTSGASSSKRFMGKVRNYAEATEEVSASSRRGSRSPKGKILSTGAAVRAAIAKSSPKRLFRAKTDSPARGSVRISVQQSGEGDDMPNNWEEEVGGYVLSNPQPGATKNDGELAEHNKQVAGGMLEGKTKTKFKRPGLAKISRSMFGRSSRSDV